MGDANVANPDDIFHIENYDDPAWGKTARGSMDIACHYLYVTDNLLDPSHVAWVHVSSFAGGGTEDVPLKVDKLEDGVVVSRWMRIASHRPTMRQCSNSKEIVIANSIMNAGCHQLLSTNRSLRRLEKVVMTQPCQTTAL